MAFLSVSLRATADSYLTVSVFVLLCSFATIFWLRLLPPSGAIGKDFGVEREKSRFHLVETIGMPFRNIGPLLPVIFQIEQLEVLECVVSNYLPVTDPQGDS